MEDFLWVNSVGRSFLLDCRKEKKGKGWRFSKGSGGSSERRKKIAKDDGIEVAVRKVVFTESQ